MILWKMYAIQSMFIMCVCTCGVIHCTHEWTLKMMQHKLYIIELHQA